MNSIFGSVALFGQPADRNRRLPFGIDPEDSSSESACWIGGAAALGSDRKLPAASGLARAGQRLVAVVDARLDYREDLLRKLGLSSEESRSQTDGDLILAAYDKWSDACVEHLEGDFAFAIWDTQQARLLCARDHLGVRPLYYTLTKERFQFSNSLPLLSATEDCSDELDEYHAASFLAGMDDSPTSTFFLDIKKLPAGHLAVVADGQMEIRQYYRLNPDHQVRHRNRAEYAEAFRETFSAAVRERLQSAGRVGCMLSGGLDSSSICAVARVLANGQQSGPVSTYSLLYERGSSSDERAFIQSVVDLGDFAPRYLTVDPPPALSTLGSFLHEQGQPFFAPGMVCNGDLRQRAALDGCTALLDGHGGDEVATTNLPYLFELAESNRWGRFAFEVIAGIRYRGLSSALAASTMFLSCGAIAAARRRVALRSRLRRFGKAPGEDSSRGRPQWAVHLGSYALVELGLLEHRRQWRSRQHITANTREAHYRLLTSPIQQTSFEVLHHQCIRRHIEPRYPFWDKRLVELCYGFPIEQKMARGLDRVSLRRAMKGILPEMVRRRPGKTDFVDNLRLSLARSSPEEWRTITHDRPEELSRFIDLEWLRHAASAAMRRFPLSSPDLSALFRCAVFASWWQTRPSKRTRPGANLMSILIHE